jgi:pimeloyl-ACP methyl ester carboxylesterase
VFSLAFSVVAVFAPCRAGSHRVDVGGFKLNVRCVGEGSPVVLLDAGAGDTSETWDWVVPDVRRFTRVCVYDRAGLGKSDPGPLPRTSDRIADELERLLARARIPGPYVLAGHSFGGLNMRLFASRHPRDVAGLVLVDATPEDYPGRAAGLRSRDEVEKLRTAVALGSPAFRSELDAMTDSAAIVRASQPPTAPVIVITSGQTDASQAFRALWAELQAKMVKTFPHAKQVLADQSGHYVQYDQPELIVQAIRELTDGAREGTKGDY